MSDKEIKPPLIFQSSFDLRSKLKAEFEKGGLVKLQEYIENEFTPNRKIQIGKETSILADVQLRHLSGEKPGKVILDYKSNNNLSNTMLMMTANLIDIDKNLQLLIRKKI